MNIGQAAKASGVSAKMIRYYESIGLVPPARRTKGNYRSYGTADIERLSFIRKALNLGFPPARVRELLVLWSSGTRINASAKSRALACIAELQARSVDLKGMIKTLRGLVFGQAHKAGLHDGRAVQGAELIQGKVRKSEAR